MKYRYIKGSPSDFKGAPDWAMAKSKSGEVYSFLERPIPLAGDRYCYMDNIYFVGYETEFTITLYDTIIAHREPVAEQELLSQVSSCMKSSRKFIIVDGVVSVCDDPQYGFIFDSADTDIPIAIGIDSISFITESKTGLTIPLSNNRAVFVKNKTLNDLLELINNE